MNSKVLVTGGCGFIGSHVAEELINQHYEIIVVDNLITGKMENIEHLKNQLTFVYADVTTGEFKELVKKHRPDFIIHLAAQVDVPLSIHDIYFDAHQNILGSLNVIDAAVKNDVKKVIFASSAAVYGEPVYLPIDQEHPVSPLSPYGLSKSTVEKYLKLSYELYGLNYTILRYSNVFGPRQNDSKESGIVNIFFNHLLHRTQPVIYGDGHQTRDFIYVKDVAKATVATLEKGDLETINVSTNTETSINDLYQMLCNLFHVHINPLYQSERKSDIRRSVLDNHKLKEVLDYEIKYSLKEGLEETLQYMEDYSTDLVPFK